MRHGEVSGTVDPVVFLGGDPSLAMVAADMEAWVAAHPCDCEALCTCDEEEAG